MSIYIVKLIIWRIIRRMGDIKDIRDFVSLVDTKYKDDKDFALAPFLIQRYSELNHKSLQRSFEVSGMAVSRKYLKLRSSAHGDLLLVDPDKGRHLLSTKFKVLPVGLWEESLKAYGTLSATVVAFLLSTACISIAIWIFHYIEHFF